jgi:hypothetical protein
VKNAASKPLTAKQKKELAALARLPDDKIDTRAIPEAKDLSDARRGMFFRPLEPNA